MAKDSATLILAIALLAASICAQRPLFIDDIDDLVEDVLSEVLDIQKARPDNLNEAQNGVHETITDINVSECWKCSSKNYDSCASSGHHESCHTSGAQKASCYLREVKRYSHRKAAFVLELVQMGCIDAATCTTQKDQNFKFGLQSPRFFKFNRCRPEGRWRNSECYQCCADRNNCMYSPNSVQMWIPYFAEEWSFGT